jgi:hypothetical protein
MAKEIDTARIAKVIASKQVTSNSVPPTERSKPVRLEQGEILANLPLVLPRLAAYATYEDAKCGRFSSIAQWT